MGLAPASVMANARTDCAGESSRAAGKLQINAARHRRERLMGPADKRCQEVLFVHLFQNSTIAVEVVLKRYATKRRHLKAEALQREQSQTCAKSNRRSSSTSYRRRHGNIKQQM